MGSLLTARGRNGGAPRTWYGAIRQQVPLGKWEAYIYDQNRNVAICFGVFDTAKEAKRALHGNRTRLNLSAALPREGDAGYSDSVFMPWQGGDQTQGPGPRFLGFQHRQQGETWGPEHVLWQGGDQTQGPWDNVAVYEEYGSHGSTQPYSYMQQGEPSGSHGGNNGPQGGGYQYLGAPREV